MYRGIRMESADEIARFDSKFRVGKRVTTDSFWSASGLESEAYAAVRQLVINTDSAKDISGLSFGVNFHSNIGKPLYTSEAILPPGVTFRVVGHDASGRIILEEIKND